MAVLQAKIDGAATSCKCCRWSCKFCGSDTAAVRGYLPLLQTHSRATTVDRLLLRWQALL
jgi:hypothetical protein